MVQKNNWVEPEWLPQVPKDDKGPFHCYVLWVTDTRQYYVGHTGYLRDRIERHFDGNVRTTAGHQLQCLWISAEMLRRTDARNFEAALKSYVLSGNSSKWERCTGLYLANGATLLDANY